MPTYQYACTSCGEELEAVQKFSDEPLTECPACGGRLRKVFSPVGVVFTGSGFYKTDSRSSAKKKTSDSATKSEDKSSGSGSGDSSSSPDKSSPDKSNTDKGKTDNSSTGSSTSSPSSSSSGQVA
jgi:putative FmdB family regulatory protein